MADVLFTNARIFDGSGDQPYTGDVFVQGHRIARVTRTGYGARSLPHVLTCGSARRARSASCGWRAERQGTNTRPPFSSRSQRASSSRSSRSRWV